MCQSKNNGGKRCHESTSTRERRKLSQKLKRAKTPESAREIEGQLTSLREATQKYGNFVLPLHIDIPVDVTLLMDKIRDNGYNPLIVGGTVRDVFMGVKPKDFDIEVYGVNINNLDSFLSSQGYQVNSVGKQFGVLKVSVGGEEIDLSVPREDSRMGDGHRGLDVYMDQDMSVEQAAERRDFTINAMMYDHQLGVAIDAYGGSEDLKNGIIRHVSDKFADDPLRPLRGFQFAARYNMKLAPETVELCQSIADRSREVPQERIVMEWEKFYSKGVHPQAGLNALSDIGWSNRIPGIDKIADHEALGRELKRATVLPLSRREPVMAALFMKRMDDHDARYFTHHTLNGHEMQARAYNLSRLNLTDAPSDSELRLQARQLKYADLSLYADYMDAQGRDTTGLRQKISALGIEHGPRPVVISAGEIMEHLGRKPGPWLGQLFKEVTRAQDEGRFTSREDALEWATNRLQ